MSDWISREAAIGALEDRRNKYLEDGPNWLQIQMDILTIRALPAVQPDADELVGHMTKLIAAGLDRIEALTAERDRLRRALHYYADFHSAPSDGPWGVNSDDFGAEARAALKGETP